MAEVTRKLLVLISDEDIRGLGLGEWGWNKSISRDNSTESISRSDLAGDWGIPCRVIELPSTEELGHIAMDWAWQNVISACAIHDDTLKRKLFGQAILDALTKGKS